MTDDYDAVLEVELGEGRKGEVKIRNGDDPAVLAQDFVAGNGLPPVVLAPLSQEIKDTMAFHHLKTRSDLDEERKQKSKAEKEKQVHKKKKEKPVKIPSVAFMTQKVEKPVHVPVKAKPEINENSRKMAERTRPKKGSVHRRMYEEAHLLREKQREAEERVKNEVMSRSEKAVKMTNKVSKVLSQTSRRSAGNEPAYQKLYRESFEAKRKKEQIIEEHKRKKEEEENSYSYQPTVNVTAFAKEDSRPVWQRLTSQAAITRPYQFETMEEMEVAKCTFRPVINETTKKIFSEHSQEFRPKKTVHESLFEDAERRRMRSQEYENFYPDDATFQPDIGSSRHHFAEGDIFERLAKEGEEIMARRLLKKEEYEAKVEREFQEMQRSQKRLSREAIEKCTQNLLAQETKRQYKQQITSHLSQNNLAQQANAKKMSAKSEKIVDEMKRARFKQIFESLGGDTEKWQIDLDNARIAPSEDPYRTSQSPYGYDAHPHSNGHVELAHPTHLPPGTHEHAHAHAGQHACTENNYHSDNPDSALTNGFAHAAPARNEACPSIIEHGEEHDPFVMRDIIPVLRKYESRLISYAEFALILDNLLSRNAGAITEILRPPKPAPPPKSFSHQPRINKPKHHSSAESVPVEHRLLNFREKTAERLKKLAEQVHEADKAQCPFRPTLYTSNRRRDSLGKKLSARMQTPMLPTTSHRLVSPHRGGRPGQVVLDDVRSLGDLTLHDGSQTARVRATSSLSEFDDRRAYSDAEE
eukprot:Rmarinus@m.8018